MNPIKNLSVIIPSYNAASWLPKTIPKVDAAIKKAGIAKAEIIVIDDGSSDDTKAVVADISTTAKLRYYKFENGGRFLARKRGIEKANYEYVLFIDTRIYIAPDGLKFIVETQKKALERVVWTSHVHLDRAGNMYARFWEAITFVAWRKYFANPRDISYGIKEFDLYPKGTTCFFAPKAAIQEANEWFEQHTRDQKTSNDDTLLIRRIAEHHSININPLFYCTYHARTNMRQFLKHVHHRGMVFVDGFLRRDGNLFFYPLIAFLVLCPAVLVAFIVKPVLALWFIPVFLVFWVLGLLICLMSGVYYKDALSFFVLSPLFVVTYGGGIWRAFVRQASAKLKP